ncbi:hypothetical protein [Modestobacter sp. NPDC049651]|uniref:hypothetical protein n=1 Tax=unclassified Modestobacter TaxID=2643866 RepID=UPI0033E7E0C4
MAAPISDAVVVDVLRRVDGVLAPLAQRLGRPPQVPAAQRAAWWADRVSRVAAGVSAAPRFAGKLADLLPLQNTVGSAVQALVVVGVATEHGLTDPAARVSLLARVLLDRDLPADRVRGLLQPSRVGYVAEAFGERRTGVRGAARSLWRVSRLLGRIDDALDARPKGKLRHRALGQLPVVGVAGGYAAEREGLRRAARQAEQLLTGAPTGDGAVSGPRP